MVPNGQRGHSTAVGSRLDGRDGCSGSGTRPPTHEIVTVIDTHRDNESGGCRWDSHSRSAPSSRSPLHLLRCQGPTPLGPGGARCRPRTQARRAVEAQLLGLRPARLMRNQGIRGASRAKKRFRSKSDPAAVRAPDLVNRNFNASRPDALWVADFARPGRASSTSPSSSKCSPGAASAGRPPVP